MLVKTVSQLGSFFRLMFRRPKHLQMAALCHRRNGDLKEYLLVTSRDSGRWVVPKGWPIRGLTSRETAMREAWEEAGVRSGKVSKDPIGTYTYGKRRENGFVLPVETLVYSVAVNEIADKFPEVDERRREWVSAEDAASMVQEPELMEIILAQ